MDECKPLASGNAGLRAELEYNFANDGTFWMSYADLVTHFNCIHVCRIFPADWHQLVLKGAWAGAYTRPLFSST